VTHRTNPAIHDGEPSADATPITRLWNRDFLLLWQGQVVSSLGDVIYVIALGFWILGVTGSTALMGSLMAASTLPRVLVSPVAGVVVDRADRRRLLILTDGIRGLAVVGVAIAAFAGTLHVWMVFVAAIVIGTCGAFFGPAVSAAFPDIVPKDQLVRANSVFSLIYTASGLVGNSAGGFLYQLVGAPLLFCFNGLSYLFSSFLLVFTRIPPAARGVPRGRFFSEMREGFTFGWKNEGLRWLIVSASFLNFFATMGIVLVLPLFQASGELGAGRYGIVMAAFSGGLVAGFSLAAALKIPPAERFAVFFAGAMGMSVCMILFPMARSFWVMPPLMVVAGCANALLNTFISVSVQLAVPAEMRGKVFSFMGALSLGLTPVAMALGGILAEFLAVRPLISGCFAVVLLLFLPLASRRSFREFVRGEPFRPAGARG
jgi:MFS family permease